MKSVTTRRFFSLLLAVCMLMNTIFAVPFVIFAADDVIPNTSDANKKDESEESISHAYQPFASIKEYQYSEKEKEVDETTLMLKVSANAPAMSPIPKELAERGVTIVRTMVDVTTPEAMAELGVSEPYRWLMVGFAEEKATEVALSFAEVPYVLDAEYNYTRQSSELPSIEENPLMANQWHLQDPSLQKAWKYLDENGLHQKLEQVVVAVIDTGVDYTHPNLVNSMWVNVNEIPGDGMDNDGNGYADDIYGISTLGNIWDANGDPMDEMGHGTHVAGIIAASEGAMGAVGVAYGAKIMAIKAGDSSGMFNDSDIIEAINYAILMGADVINMSFGSYARSAAIEDALALAYTSAVLVAAAGNDGLDIVVHGMPSYPASYNFVIGVMATDMNGRIAGFSNTDYVLRRNSMEYEICAPGASIFSTLPANRYASWSGTSMACPYISAVAAILRAKYDDKSVYSSRYIMGQLVGTAVGSDGAFPLVDPYAALTEIPEPDVSFYDYYIFDDPAYSEKNNGDGIIDAGETIGLGVLIRNHWGQARNTKVKLIAAANSTDATLCPHVTWITDTIDYGDIGTFNSANNGFSYDTDGVITGISNPFMFTVAENTPNDYHIPFSLVIECESYTESDETKTYRFATDTFNIQVRKGYELPRLIDTDMTLTADRYYIISGSTLIESGVTVTVEPGTQIQFWGDYSKELYAGTDVAELLVDGELIIRGTETNPVDIFPSGSMSDMKVDIKTRMSSGRIHMQYCNVANPVLNVTTIDHCYFTQLMFDYMCELYKDMDGHWYHSIIVPRVYANKISNSIFYELGYRYGPWDYRLDVGGELVGNLFDSCGLNFNTWSVNSFKDNVFLKNYRLVEAQINDRTYLTSEFNIGTSYSGSNTMIPFYPVKNPETGSTYFVLHTSSLLLAEDFAKLLGGSVVRIDNQAEQDFLLEYAKRYYAYNEELRDYNWGPYLNHLFVGFYGNGENDVTYIGEGDAEKWLNIPKNTSIPMIQTSYYKPQEGEATTQSWVTTFYSGDSYWMESLLSRNPSNQSHRDHGVIIEIPGEITPLSVSLECDALTIPSNTVDYRVLATAYPATDNYTLSWASSDESVVKVSADGKLTAVGLGTAVITVTIDGMELSDTMVVVVTQYYAPESITDSTTDIRLNAYQQTHKLTPVIAPSTASAIIEYSSSDTSVAVVGFDGTVTAISSGTATVTAKIVGTDLSLTYTVNVIIPPSSIELDKNYVILTMDEAAKKSLAYHFSPKYATEGRVEYISSDESVVLVSANGELTPVAPGSAVVYVSFPEIDRALQAKVVVIEDSSSMNIQRGSALSDWEGASVLYAEDGTTYLLMNEEVFGNSKLVQEFPQKTKALTCTDIDYWYYIDMENNLRVLHRHSQGEGTLIAEGVSNVWSGRWSGNRVYYQKIDGTIWFYAYGSSVQNEWVENIVDAMRYNGNYLFLDEQGSLWIDKTPENNGQPLTPLSFEAQLYNLDKKIVFLTQYGCFDEEGTYYRFNYTSDGLVLEEYTEFSMARLNQTLKVTWDQVVDATHVASGSTEHWLLLLADGRIVYAGYYYPGSTNMLADIISIPAYSSIEYCFLDLDQTFVDLGRGSLIAADGSALTYIAEYNAVLGNGKTYNNNQSLKRPIAPWFGTKDDGQNVTFNTVTVTNGEGSSVTEQLALQGVLENKVDPNSNFVIALSKPAVVSSLSSVVLKNEFGKKVELTASLDRFGKNLIITPQTPLQAGYDYTLSIPAGVIADEFTNTNRTFTFSFTVSGVAVYDVPVTGIVVDGENAFTLEYGQTKALGITVLPENASVKKVYWKSSDETVAVVNSSGYVTARYNGTAIITATTSDGGYTATFTVTVATQPTSVSLTTGYFLLEVGETGNMQILAYPIYAGLGTLTYGSNNTNIATVDQNGVVTAKGIGSTLIYVTSSTTGETYYALVDVVADSSFAHIVSAYRNEHHEYCAYFIAKDNSVWYVSTNGYGDENTYLPRKTSVKAKQVFQGYSWSYTYFISMDDVLYEANSYLRDASPLPINEKVASMVAYEEHIFYVDLNGSVYYYNKNTGVSTKCSTLTGIEEVYYSSSCGAFFFVGQTGTLRYTTPGLLENGVSGGIFKSIELPNNEQVAFHTRAYILGTNGTLYGFSDNNDTLSVYEMSSITQLEEYKAIKDQIVEISSAAQDHSESIIARLADGSVYFIGSAYNIPVGFSDCVDTSGISADTSSYIARPVKGISNAVDLEAGYIVLADGTVRSYYPNFQSYSDAYKTMLANNNWESKSYNVPVIAWFGAQSDRNDIWLENIQSVSGQTSMEIIPGTLNQGVRVDSSIELQFNKLLYSVVNGVSVMDANGVEIPVTYTIFGNTLIVTPKQPLASGMYYNVIVWNSAVKDIFQNSAVSTEFNFITEGTLALPIPVTGITDETTQLTLSYGETQQLMPAVAPANATLPLVIWTTTDESVVSVTPYGMVTGWANGKATVTVTTLDGGFSHSYEVTVSTKPTNLSLVTGYFNLGVGEVGQMELSVYPTYADLGTLTFGSNNTSVATVDQNGVVTAKGIGSTLVYVTCSTTGETYYALVDVVEDPAFADIVSVDNDNFWANYKVFIAEDNTVWYVTNEQYGNENIYLPRKADYKALQVVRDTYWGDELYYISLDNKLYRTNFRNQWQQTLISEDVVSVASHGEYLFYTKLDGHTYFYNNNTGTSIKCQLLIGTASIKYSSNFGAFFFINQTGVLYYAKGDALEGGITNSLFKTVSIPNGEKIVSLTRSYAIGENGGIYDMRFEGDSIVVTEVTSVTQDPAYLAIKDQIVEIVAATYESEASFIARMKDGSAYYISTSFDLPIGLQHCVDTSIVDTTVNSYIFVRPISGISNVVDLATGYFVLSNGTVRAYLATRYEYEDAYKMMLANNNLDRKSYYEPVVSWFGAQGNHEDILLDKIQSVVGETATDLLMGGLNQGVNTNATIVMHFNKLLYSIINNVTLVDAAGNVIPTTTTISNNSLIITPAQELAKGMYYTVSISAGSVQDIFRNTVSSYEFCFITEGTLNLPVPVTGITDEVTQVTLSYGQTQSLMPIVTPTDATLPLVTWTTTDESVVSVTPYGMVTGWANGKATVIVTTLDGGFSHSYEITVSTKPEDISLTTGYFHFEVGEVSRMELSVYPTYADLGTLTFGSNNANVATVDQNGVVTANGIGSTLVYVTCSTTGETYYALVDVVENSASADIVKAFRGESESGVAFFIAEDNTVWYISTNSYGNENVYLPRKAYFKAKAVAKNSGWGYIYFISPNNQLYRADSDLSYTWTSHISDDVASVTSYSQHVFYVKLDGSTYYYNANTGMHTKCSLLTGTTELYYHDSYSRFFFVNQTGTLRCIDVSALENGITNRIFKAVTVPGGEPIVSTSRYYAFGENGGIYRMNLTDGEIVLSQNDAFASDSTYQAIKDQIVKIVPADYSGDATFIAQLADGSAYLISAGYRIPIGLQDCIESTYMGAAASSTAFVSVINGISNVADVATGYFVLSDGTVRAYQTDSYESYRRMLGNNNTENKTYNTHVVSWFGAQGAYEDILLEGAQGVVGETVTDIVINDLTEELNVQSSFVLTFNKQLFAVEDGISLIDMGGILVPITVTVSDRSMVITPNAALKEGTLYQLSIPAGSVLDIFDNTTGDLEINFTTVGDLHFEVPVQSITDTITQLQMSYGDVRQLTPTIVPAEASMKRVSWSTSNANVATVDQNGLVTGLQNGTAIITATTFDGDYTYQYTVKVYTPVESFVLSETFVVLDPSVQKSIQLFGKVTPSYLVASDLFTWSVADPEIATVSANGTVTALKPGVTAVYCYCEGITNPATCIISVLPKYEYAFINRVFTTNNNGFLFEAKGCLWMSSSYYTYPKKLEFQIPTEGEESKTLDTSLMKQILCTPQQSYSEGSSSFLALFLQEDGTLLFYRSEHPEAPCFTKTGVEKAIYANGYLVLLMKDGTLVNVYLHGFYYDPATDTEMFSISENPVTEIAGIQDMVWSEDSSRIFLLQNNKGLVWTYLPTGGGCDLQLFFNEEPITDINLGKGSFMRGESGKLYPLDTYQERFQNTRDELISRGFYNLNVEIVDVATVFNDNYFRPMLLLTNDGRLASFGANVENSPLSEKYSGYKWTRDEYNQDLYYIETGKTVSEIGPNWIIFADGSVKMFGRYQYLGNGKYTDHNLVTSLCSPYFMDTEIDIRNLILQKITVGDTEIDISGETPKVDSTNKIVLEYSLPLIPTDYLLATTVRDSQGNYPNFELRIDGRKIVLVFEENLRAGETYTVTVYNNAAEDIFHNTASMINFAISINEATATAQSYSESLYPTTKYSPDWTLKQLQAEARKYYDEVLNAYIAENSTNIGNAFLNAFANPDTTSWMNLIASQSINTIGSLIGNFWGTTKTDLIDRIIYDVNDSFNYGEILYDPMLSTASETAYPFVTSIVVKNSEGNIVSSVGMEDITVEVYFNRDMDTNVQPFVSYGSDYPFGDFAVTGDWQNARTWVGTTKISAVTGSGTQYFKVRNAVAANDSWLVTGNDYERFAFTIATSGAKSMSMQANGADGYVALEWTQDDYETMAGYNVYRSELMDGSYTKLNSTLISHDVTSFVDDDVQPGVPYYYYFTVVGTDLKESEPSGIAMAAAQDTTPPTINHTAVVQAPQGAAISIVATVRDNLNISTVKLYYRTKGQTTYSCVDMYRNADSFDKYTATIPANVVTADGVEYYIEASDGRQNGNLYSASAPQSVRTYQMYYITVMTVSGGRITVSKTRAKAGDYITAYATPDNGYAYLAESLTYTVDGETYTVTNGGFYMPEEDIVITATFLQESAYAYGDINRDGAVNSADAILLLRYDAGLEELDDEQMLLADVNRDGKITVFDANEILRIDVGL